MYKMRIVKNGKLLILAIVSIMVMGGCTLQKDNLVFHKPVIFGNESMVVFFRQGGSNDSIASIWIDDKIVGTLLPDRYAQSYVCTGKRQVRIETHNRDNNLIIAKAFTARKGEVLYFQVSDTSSSGNFSVHQVDSVNAENILKNLKSKSHIINRHGRCNLKYIELSSDALFSFGESRLSSAGKSMLDDLAKNIHQNITVKKLRIEGFTDRLGSSAVNDRLSLSRAKAVATYLTTQNISLPIETLGWGERFPISKGCVGKKSTPKLVECLAPDRRVRIETIGLSAQNTNK